MLPLPPLGFSCFDLTIISLIINYWGIYLSKSWGILVSAIVYDMTDFTDAINVLSLFILNRFRVITREVIKAMLDFDILDTVAGRQVYDEGLEKGRTEGRQEGLSSMREMLELNLKNRFGELS